MAAQNPSLLGSVYSGYVPQTDPNESNKVTNKFGIFEFSEDLNATPWHVPSPLNLVLATAPLPKFKIYLPKFSSNGICTIEEHLNSFSNSYNKIGANANYVCWKYGKGLDSEDLKLFLQNTKSSGHVYMHKIKSTKA